MFRFAWAEVQSTSMPKFIPGLELCRLFYQSEVKPILKREFPDLRYSAALIGWGSEVLGFDTALSRDHHWGPRVLLFLSVNDYSSFKDKISRTLSNNLPCEFLGYSTNYSTPEPNGIRHPIKIAHGPVNHMINIYTIKSFIETRLGFDPSRRIEVIDWLTFPQQRLLELVSGAVFHDGLGELGQIRRKLKFYPRDVWLYLLSAQWKRISQEEAFVGRTGDTGDELGSQVVAARLVREIMKLTFLMEKQYAPYSKWFGTAFSKLKTGARLSPVLREVLLAETWKARERKLGEAYTIVANKHNALKITRALPTRVIRYYDRPYLVIDADEFARSTKEAIRDPDVKRIPSDVGSIDQFTDSTDLIQDLAIVRQLGVIYKRHW
jgi:Domain of unknown function (DUF4037)